MKITDQIPAMQTLPHRAKAVVNFLSASILKVLKYSIVKETMSTTMHLFTFYLESDGMSTNNDYKHSFGALSLQFC
jgi:hypothetical protein